MGLDIYLTDAAQNELETRHEKEWDALWNRKESGEITQEEYDELREKITPYPDRGSHKSERYPDHLFDRRYLRSSYNEGGFNHAVPEMLGEAEGTYPHQRGTLYWIFEPLAFKLYAFEYANEDEEQPAITDGEAPEVIDVEEEEGSLDINDIPLLEECSLRAKQIAAELAAADPLRVTSFSPNQLGGREFLEITSDKALQLYREEIAKRAGRDSKIDGWGSAYSNRDGDWFPDGFTILAAIPGAEKMFFSDDPWPAVHVIYRADEAHDSYIQSAEIVVEFIEEAIDIIKRDGAAYISWSS